MKVKTSKGFTLAELLIVMAIIVVLAAVAIPTFGRQLETARETGDMELIRSAYTEALAMAVLDASDGKLDGQNGGTEFPKFAADTKEVVVYGKGAASGATTSLANTVTTYTSAIYSVSLNNMDQKAAISQTGYGWQFVNRYIMGGASVPNVKRHTDTDARTGGTNWVQFEFVLPTTENNSDKNNNVRLAIDGGGGVNDLTAITRAITVDVPTGAGIYS